MTAPDRSGGTVPNRWRQTFRALRHPNYRLFYFGQSVSLTGTWMQTIAQSWLVIELTNSEAAVGLVTTLQFLPITLLVLFGGVIADRLPKRNLIVATRLLALSQALLLAFLVSTGYVELWHVYCLALVLGLANAFEQPARQAFIVELVGREDLMNAIALNSGNFNAARLIGPSVAGVVIAVAGVEAAFLLNALSFAPSILLLTAMDLRDLNTSGRRPGGSTGTLSELREGISYVLKTPAALLIIILMAFVGTFGFNFIVIVPLLAKFVLNGGSVELGFLTAAIGLGALVSALVIAGNRRTSRFVLFAGGACFSLLLGVVALSEWYALTLILLIFVGVANIAFATTANTSLQLATPDHLRGRVMALFMLLVAGSTPIGASFTGLVAVQFGVQTAIGLLALLCLVGVSLGFLYYLTHKAEVERTSEAARYA
jgi:MFS family permease